MCQPLLAIEALCLKATVPQHFYYLGVFLSVLAEHKLALVVVVFILSTSPVLATLYIPAVRMRHQIGNVDIPQTFPLFYKQV